ncbi:hypothetical protein RE2895_59740 [Rhodococcus erythropolis]|nr:hypothetical protein RE2895_59740 [Rhodococcus erythropolis]
MWCLGTNVEPPRVEVSYQMGGTSEGSALAVIVLAAVRALVNGALWAANYVDGLIGVGAAGSCSVGHNNWRCLRGD